MDCDRTGLNTSPLSSRPRIISFSLVALLLEPFGNFYRLSRTFLQMQRSFPFRLREAIAT